MRTITDLVITYEQCRQALQIVKDIRNDLISRCDKQAEFLNKTGQYGNPPDICLKVAHDELVDILKKQTG